ncbi:MAG: hypothetical protein JST63_06275 [Bacteroidetes bacterium]|nr:hypothetical protein [Bacteroidota bacterium]
MNSKGGSHKHLNQEIHKEAAAKKSENITAIYYNSGFEFSHDTYNGIYAASDGLIYYVLCSESIEEGGKMYSFDPATKAIRLCGDLTEACGEKGLKTIPQGKSHVNFVEANEKLYFGTHIGYYSNIEGTDRMGIPPEGYKPYPGGHLLSFDMHSRTFEDYGVVPHKEGVLTMNMDTQRNLMYGITWPTGYFFRYDIGKKEMKDLGRISEDGESGTKEKYRTLCRSITINPDTGMVYFSTSDGVIFQYDPVPDQVQPIVEDNLRKDYFGQYDPASPGHMGYNWRQVFWHAGHKAIYGIHGNSGYFFRFDPATKKVEILDRITSKPSQRSGMFDQFSYGYLGLMIGHNQRTVYYLTGSPMYINGKRVTGKSCTAKGEAKGLENLHLVTYDIVIHKYQDHGPIFFEDGSAPLYVNSIAIGFDRHIYFMGRVPEKDKIKTDLISIPDPLKDEEFSTPL